MTHGHGPLIGVLVVLLGVSGLAAQEPEEGTAVVAPPLSEETATEEESVEGRSEEDDVRGKARDGAPPEDSKPVETQEDDRVSGLETAEEKGSEARQSSTPSKLGSSSSVRLHGTLALAKAVSGHQRREYGFGGAGLFAAEWGPSALWGVQGELGFIGLGSGDRNPPEGLEELGGSTGFHAAVGVRERPFAGGGLKGPWLSAVLGMEVTGRQLAPMMDVFVGYDFTLSEHLGLGPQVGYLLVLQTRDSPRPDNANLLLAGLHGTFDFGSAAPPVQDSDHDGLLDPNDACPLDPEDKDGFEDDDGCPELDNDEDGILDSDDRCPLDPEDVDDFNDKDGCPDPDNDNDGILDASDQCPLDPEDKDEFADEDGCPDPDNDKDGILDLKDLCPNEPEIINGIADNDGCPDSESVRVVGDKIELDQKIHFWTNSDRIRAMSYPVLEKLAGFLKEHPEYVHVDVEGHADSRGDEEFNLDLSKRRANSIAKFLVKRGVVAGRLSSDGFGSSKPLMEGKSERAWFMNRRVEFVVTRNREIKVDPATGKPITKGPAFGVDKKEGSEQ